MGTLLRTAGADRRVGDLFGDATLASRLGAMAKQSLRGVENVYTQHTPPLAGLLEAAVRGRLKDADYPLADPDAAAAAAAAGSPARPPRLVVAFIVGGATYAEARVVADANAAADRGEGWAAGCRFVLGGTGGVLNSAAFLAALREIGAAERAHGGAA